MRRSLQLFVVVLIFAFTLTGCAGDKTGPKEVKWDRDECERCRMKVSEAPFSAQVRGGERRDAVVFDDIGCAVMYMEGKGWLNDPKVELWVPDYRGTRENLQWLDGRNVAWKTGLTTPMDYGFGALPKDDPAAQEETVSFDVMVKRVRAEWERRTREKAMSHSSKMHQHSHESEQKNTVQAHGGEQ
jgi:copper chaperone NosL